MSALNEQLIVDWWSELVDDKHKGQRAKLKRCKTREEILLNPDQIRLKQILKDNKVNGVEVIASLLANIKNDGSSQKKLAEQMASNVKNTSRPWVSEIRFRCLLKCDSREELYPQLLRVIKMLDAKSSMVNVYDLIESIHFWGDDRKRRWAEDYYGNLPD